MIKISLFTSIKKSSEVFDEIEIDKVLTMIQVGTFKDKITVARMYGKGTEVFDNIKMNLQCVCFNGTFNEKRKKQYLKSLSTMIYIDIDGCNCIEKLTTDPYVYAAWKSFSGTGVAALIKTTNINPDNFTEYWKQISNYLERKYQITVDKQTKDVTRINVISYDTNIYINRKCDAFSLNIERPINTNKYVKTDTPKEMLVPFEYLSNTLDYKKINSILHTMLNPEEYKGLTHIVKEEGQPCYDFNIFKKIEIGSRHKCLLNCAITCIYNKRKISKEELFKMLLF